MNLCLGDTAPNFKAKTSLGDMVSMNTSAIRTLAVAVNI